MVGNRHAPRFCHTFGHSPILWQTSSLEQLLSTRPIPDMLYFQQPPSPSLHRLSPTSQVLWPRLTSVGSAMPCDMGYIFRCVSHRPPRLRCNSLHPMQPLHLRDRVRVVWDFDLSCSLVRSATPSYAVSVRRLGTLPVRVDRFPLPSGFLQIPPRGGHPCLRLTLPTTKRVVDFHHQAIAHGGRTTERIGPHGPKRSVFFFRKGHAVIPLPSLRRTAWASAPFSGGTGWPGRWRPGSRTVRRCP